MTEDLIDKFFNKKLITSHNTRKNYRGNVNKFFTILNKDINTYFTKDKDLEEYEDDLTFVYNWCDKNDVPLLTRRTFFNSVRQFLSTYDKRTRQLDFWDVLKNHIRGASPVSNEFVPNTQDIKSVLLNSDICSRAMFLIMCSCGCRLGELLALNEEDINTKVHPATVKISKTYDRKKPGNISNLTKTRKPRTCFISDEATEAYLGWLKVRQKYLLSAIGKTPKNYTKDANDIRVFPMSDENAREKWYNMVVKSGLFSKGELKDPRTKRLVLHPHCLRKFFRSYFGQRDIAEHLSGHATGMDKFYRDMKKEDLAQEYLKYMPNVSIFSTQSKDIKDLDEKMREKDKKIAELETKLTNIENLLGLKKQLEEMIKEK